MRLACAEDAAKQGGSACKSALPKVLPGLCKFSELPPAAVPILVAVTRLPDKKDEALRKLQRVAFYLLQVAFGLGAAGTPQPYSAQTGAPPRNPPTRHHFCNHLRPLILRADPLCSVLSSKLDRPPA